jgi:septal ring factor EnvC (AmiA/AmiB activator)
MEHLSSRMDTLAHRMEGMEGVLRNLASAIERLARLEERHIATAEGLGRAFKAIEALEARLKEDIEQVEKHADKLGERLEALERHAPVHSMASGMVFKAATHVVTAVVGALLVLVLK